MPCLKLNDRSLKYDIVAAFDYILDVENPRLRRAIKLYELQTAILFGKELRTFQQRKKEYPENWIRVSRAALATARMVSSMRLLEYIVADVCLDVDRRIPLKKLVRNAEAAKLLREIIRPNNSKRMAYGLSWRELDRLLRTRRDEQTAYAPLYDVSLNFALNAGPGSYCNWSRAAALLGYYQDKNNYEIIRRKYPTLSSEYAAYKDKDPGNYFAGFIWLDHFGGAYLRPLRPIASSFADELLAKVDDTVGLRTYLAQYDFIRSRFAEQDYHLPKLRLAVPIPPQEVKLEPLPNELSVLI